MAHPGKLERSISVYYDPTPKKEVVDGLGALNNRPVGAQSLVTQRRAEEAPARLGGTPARASGPSSETPQEAPAPKPEPAPTASRVSTWIQWFVDSTVVPAINHIGTEWLVSCLPAPCQGTVRPLAHVFTATVAKPAIQWLSHRLLDALSDPKTFKDSVVAGVKLAVNEPRAAIAAVRSALPDKLPTKPQIGRAARELILGSSDAAATMLMLNLAGRAVGYPNLASTLDTLAPHFGHTFRALFDFGFDTAVPMTKVADEHVPEAGDALDVCSIWPATVSSVAGRLDGHYDADVTFQATSDHPWVSLAGSATVTTGQEKRVVGITKLTDARIVIGGADKYMLSKLTTTSYGEHTGWTLAAGAMKAVKGDAPATLQKLTISPSGWIEGAFVRDEKPGLLGGKAPEGVLWPAVTAAPSQGKPPAAEELALAGPRTSLAAGVHDAIVGHRNAWLMKYPMLAIGWATGYSNLLAHKEKAAAEAYASQTASPTKSWLSNMDPTGLLAQIAEIDLVPSFLRTGYPKLQLDPYELKIGREPSLSFGMSTRLQLFPAMSEASATGVVVAWLPLATPTVQLRAGKLAFGDSLEVFGLELEPGGGVRSPHARVKVPLPVETFSLGGLVLAADYLTVGHEIGFRSARMTAQQLSIGGIVSVKSFEVGVQAAKDPRFTATIAGGEAKVPGVTTLAFDGTVSWGGGRAAEGDGKLAGAGLSVLDGMITATALAGTLAVRGGTSEGEVSAKDFAIAWKDYLLKTTADVKVDKHGLAKASIKTMEVWKAGEKIGAATGIEYERGKTLVIGSLALDLPSSGSIRATKADASGDTPRLATTDLDLSSLVRKPADKGEAPKPEAPKKPAGIAASNLARLEIGPAGASPFLALDFTQQKRDEVAPGAEPAKAGAIAAVISGDLRRFKLPSTLVQVERSAADESDVKVTLAGIHGDGYSIRAATYEAGVLAVTDANVQIDVLLGAAVPDALRGLASSLKTSFTIDTRTNRLRALAISGKLNGKLFGGAVTIQDATAELSAAEGPIEAGSLVSGLALDGTIRGTVSAKAYGVKATLSGTVDFPSGTPTLSGSGSAGPVAVEVTGVTFAGGRPMFQTARATITPASSDAIKFVAWKDKLKLSKADRGKVVIVAAKKVEVEPDSGLPVAAESEQVADDEAPAPPGREIGVHLPQIKIHDDVFVLKASDVIVPGDKDPKTVTIGAEASLALGMLRGGMRGTVTLPVPGGAPAPDRTQIALDVESATIGGLELTGIRYEQGRLRVARTSVPTPTLLGGFPVGLGLTDVTWTATDLEIDVPSRTVRVGSLAAEAKAISLLGGAVSAASVSAQIASKPTAVDETSLIPRDWALTLAATGARIGNDALSIGGSGKLVIDRTGLRSGEITETTFRCGVAEASVGPIALTPDGWSAKDVSVVIGNGTKLGFDPVAGLPSWLSTAADYQVRATFPLAWRDKHMVWPTLPQVTIDVLKAGISLPGGIKGAFERTAGKKTASFTAPPLKGGFNVGVQIPLAHGVGLEVGGGLSHEVSLDARDIALADGDDLAFAGKVTGAAKLSGRVRVGVFGGVPALFTVSAGLYAGLDLSATLVADASGAWKLPKTAGKSSSGAVELYLAMSDPETAKGTMLTGEAGAYASISVLGFGRTIEKPLAKAQIAEVVAHGYAKLDTASGLSLLPVGQFPTHSLRVHPKLDDLLTGGDTKHAIAVARQAVDRGVAKVKASEELLKDAPKAAPTSTPWIDDKPELDEEAGDAEEVMTESAAAVKAAKTAVEADRACLKMAREKLADHQAKVDALPRGSKKKIAGRAAMDADLATRLDGYAEHQGLVAQKTKLSITAMRKKIEFKKEEIAAFEARIAEKEAAEPALRAKQVADENEHTRAARKADLAGKTKGDVDKDLARRQRRLLEMYGSLQAAHRKANDRAARSSGKLVKLEADQADAQKRVDALGADPLASATEKKFWTAQLAFLTEEIKRLKAEAAPAPIALSSDATAAFERAKLAQPTARRKLSDSVAAVVTGFEGQIEATTLELGETFIELDKLADTVKTKPARDKLVAKRQTLLAKLAGLQTQLDGALKSAEELE